MNLKQALQLSIVAAALMTASATAAADPQAPSRSEVKAHVMQARANGELIRAGEAAEPFVVRATGPQRSRQELRAEVLQARAAGALVPAGQGPTLAIPTTSMLARADVRESVRQARLNGELIPAGERMEAFEWQARARTPQAASYAANTRR